MLSALVLLPDLAPAFFLHFDAVLVGGFLDPPPCRVALIVADAFDLVEAANRVADVAGVVERLLAFFGKGELVLVEAVALLFAEFCHGVAPFTSSTHQKPSRVTKSAPLGGETHRLAKRQLQRRIA